MLDRLKLEVPRECGHLEQLFSAWNCYYTSGYLKTITHPLLYWLRLADISRQNQQALK